jgi:hypothetical protein
MKKIRAGRAENNDNIGKDGKDEEKNGKGKGEECGNEEGERINRKITCNLYLSVHNLCLY